MCVFRFHVFVLMSERKKTMILSILVIIAVTFILYVRGGYEHNFIDTLR